MFPTTVWLDVGSYCPVSWPLRGKGRVQLWVWKILSFQPYLAAFFFFAILIKNIYVDPLLESYLELKTVMQRC